MSRVPIKRRRSKKVARRVARNFGKAVAFARTVYECPECGAEILLRTAIEEGKKALKSPARVRAGKALAARLPRDIITGRFLPGARSVARRALEETISDPIGTLEAFERGYSRSRKRFKEI
jgi:predicted RNA-binding Zn-ribbon protein involved in translation (DUF1610 family)